MQQRCGELQRRQGLQCAATATCSGEATTARLAVCSDSNVLRRGCDARLRRGCKEDGDRSTALQALQIWPALEI
ncbi:hypothetical protein WN944_002752 [Citrus x changshan-huyou]|uniref:Uncharacterized protein n=1 Tax=Citrus x changshan-huyou TaxID=2935761 RepID=A0AAP0MH53_9ROSI